MSDYFLTQLVFRNENTFSLKEEGYVNNLSHS